MSGTDPQTGDLEPRAVVRSWLRDPGLLARRGACEGVCPFALRRRFGTGDPVGACDCRRSTRWKSAGRDCPAEASTTENGRTARELGGTDSLLQRERQPYAV